VFKTPDVLSYATAESDLAQFRLFLARLVAQKKMREDPQWYPSEARALDALSQYETYSRVSVGDLRLKEVSYHSPFLLLFEHYDVIAAGVGAMTGTLLAVPQIIKRYSRLRVHLAQDRFDKAVLDEARQVVQGALTAPAHPQQYVAMRDDDLAADIDFVQRRLAEVTTQQGTLLVSSAEHPVGPIQGHGSQSESPPVKVISD
jgi:hypothetical protein